MITLSLAMSPAGELADMEGWSVKGGLFRRVLNSARENEKGFLSRKCQAIYVRRNRKLR